jgi:hypothetical protein
VLSGKRGFGRGGKSDEAGQPSERRVLPEREGLDECYQWIARAVLWVGLGRS